MKPSLLLLPWTALAGLVFVAAWCAASAGAAHAPPVPASAVAALGDVESTVLAVGVVEPRTAVDVGAQVSGQVRAIHVAEGQWVQAGQLLAEIDPTLQQGQVLSAQADLDLVLAQRQGRHEAVAQGERVLRRTEALLDAGSAAPAEVEGARSQLTSAQAELLAAQAQEQRARGLLENARATLAYTRIVAPMAGQVLSVPAKAGQTLLSAQAAPVILKLADTRRMTVRLQVSEIDVAKLHPGMPVRMSPLGDSTRTYRGQLRAIESGTASEAPGAPREGVHYPALFEVDNADGALRPGMTARAALVLAQALQVPVVPIAALRQRTDGSDAVRVWQQGRAVERSVRVGLRTASQAALMSGLTAGERVLLDAASQPVADADDDRAP